MVVEVVASADFGGDGEIKLGAGHLFEDGVLVELEA